MTTPADQMTHRQPLQKKKTRSDYTMLSPLSRYLPKVEKAQKTQKAVTTTALVFSTMRLAARK